MSKYLPHNFLRNVEKNDFKLNLFQLQGALPTLSVDILFERIFQQICRLEKISFLLIFFEIGLRYFGDLHIKKLYLNFHQPEYFTRYMPKYLPQNFSSELEKNELRMNFSSIVKSSFNHLSVDTPLDTIFQFPYFLAEKQQGYNP